jgi:hypothetical protein
MEVYLMDFVGFIGLNILLIFYSIFIAIMAMLLSPIVMIKMLVWLLIILVLAGFYFVKKEERMKKNGK